MIDSIARHRSISRAAAELNLTQSALSHAISAIELQWGITLFTRQLATMMKAGVPLLQAFDIVGKGHANPAVGKDLTDWVSHGATEVDIQSSAVDAFEVVQATSEVMPASPAGSLDEPADTALFVDAFDLMNNLQPTSWLVKDYIEMETKDKVTFYRTPPEILQAQLRAYDQVAEKKAGENPLFKEIVESQRAFAQRVLRWDFNNNVDRRMAYNHYFGRPAAGAPAKGAAAKKG